MKSITAGKRGSRGRRYKGERVKSVTVSKLQVAILARSSREMSQTVRIY